MGEHFVKNITGCWRFLKKSLSSRLEECTKGSFLPTIDIKYEMIKGNIYTLSLHNTTLSACLHFGLVLGWQSREFSVLLGVL